MAADSDTRSELSAKVSGMKQMLALKSGMKIRYRAGMSQPKGGDINGLIMSKCKIKWVVSGRLDSRVSE